MGNTFRVINYDGDIEISIYKKANAVFKTNEYNETEDVCIHKETINIFNLLKENQELKQKLNWIAFGDDPELALRYLRKIGYVDFDKDRKFENILTNYLITDVKKPMKINKKSL